MNNMKSQPTKYKNNKTYRMKPFISLTAIVALLVVSCSQPAATDKKAKLDSLLKEQDKLSVMIDKLQAEIQKEGGDSAVKKTLVEYLPVQAGAFISYIDVQGKVDADENVSLSTEVPGTITKINVKPGDEVSKGQVLAETDARAIQQSISDMETNMALVNQLYEKQKNLWEQKIGTEVQYLQAKTNKESMEKKMGTLQEQLRMSKIISPINGTVDAVDIKIGQAVAPGVPAIRVINFSNLKVKAELAEAYAGRVKKGDIAKVYFPDTHDSIIAKVNFAARAINTLTRTFTVEILLDNKKDYHPNMVTNIKINDYTSNTISVPVKLLQADLQGNQFVYVFNNGKAEKKIVKTGREYNGAVEIKEGLKPGDNVIIKGYDQINEGDLLVTQK
jgi:RND family efflux transporter MFP subunit